MASEKNKIDSFFKDLGSLITKFRKEKNYTLEELGFQIGLDRSHMHRIEKGQPLTVKTIIKLSLALNKQPKDFFDINFDFKEHELNALIKTKKSPKR